MGDKDYKATGVGRAHKHHTKKQMMLQQLPSILRPKVSVYTRCMVSNFVLSERLIIICVVTVEIFAKKTE